MSHIDISKHIHADFVLTCQGDSAINVRIFGGDIGYIWQQDTVESEAIAAALIDNAATLKHIGPHFPGVGAPRAGLSFCEEKK